MTLTRAKLEQLVSDLIERTRGMVMKALEDAGLRSNEINEVVLVHTCSRGGYVLLHFPVAEKCLR
jgi:molecular chaperone DnaK (HSP70)